MHHVMEWPSAEQYWHVMTEGGPWNARKMQFGEDHMHDLKRRFMKLGGYQAESPLKHSPAARLVVIRKATPSSSSSSRSSSML